MAAADQDGPPLTELESLQLKANQVTDESLESTRRMIALCEDVSSVKIGQFYKEHDIIIKSVAMKVIQSTCKYIIL